MENTKNDLYIVMNRKGHIILKRNQQSKRSLLMQYRYAPYVLIMMFTGAMTLARVYLIPDWTATDHVISFITQSVVMTGIWHLVKWLSRKLDKFMPFEDGPLTRIVFQQLITLLILSPLVAASYYYAKPNLPSFVNKQMLAVTFVLFTLVVALFNFSFYAVFFFRNWQTSIEDKANLEVQAAQLEKEKFDLQYHQLRNQVNPHYLFNTLSSLDGLIHSDPELASEFVRHMAKVYRYVLQHKESEVVNVYKEIDFIQHYIELMHIRYADGLSISHHVSAEASDKGIVMVTLQMLIDNAIKHNMIQPSAPLTIEIKDDGDYLAVSNNKQLRKQIETSNGQGLKQLCQLYAYLTDRQVVVEDNEERYTIKIPLL